MSAYRLRVDADGFLAQHWQRQHAFLPGAMAPFAPPANAAELAGLALEDGVDSRIIHCEGGQWRQRRGPFDADDFQRSGAWSLLVQSVDHYWEDALQLLMAVDFLPTWRLDDVLMSYATDGGSAGPHYDNYDVFIVQGEGQRRWQIGAACDAESPLQPDTELRLLSEFDARHEYLMQAGDVLYIPPGIAHWGISVGESTSFSIGFRAPRLSDLLAQWVDNRLASLPEDALLRDPQREATHRPGEISRADLSRARRQLAALLEDDDGRWLGEALTARPQAAAVDEAVPDLSSADPGVFLMRSPDSALAWQTRDDGLRIFAQGQSRDFSRDSRSTVELLCAQRPLTLAEAKRGGALALVEWLLEEGCIELSE